MPVDRASAHVGRQSVGLAFWGLAAIALVILLTGCGSTGPAPVDEYGYGPAPKGYYRVRRGDTLAIIAKRKRVSWRALARWNGLGPPYTIYAGKLLRIKSSSSSRRVAKTSSPKRSTKGGTSKSPRKKSASVSPSRSGAAKKTAGSAAASSGIRWQWPIRGAIRQRYRSGDRTRQGVRIAGRAGQTVAAAAAGSVVYSGSGLKGYGNLIIVKHNSRYLSAYGFNRRLLVKEGERVKRGQTLAEVGQAGSGEYLLHFEIRRDGRTVDPLLYLPR